MEEQKYCGDDCSGLDLSLLLTLLGDLEEAGPETSPVIASFEATDGARWLCLGLLVFQYVKSLTSPSSLFC